PVRIPTWKPHTQSVEFRRRTCEIGHRVGWFGSNFDQRNKPRREILASEISPSLATNGGLIKTPNVFYPHRADLFWMIERNWRLQTGDCYYICIGGFADTVVGKFIGSCIIRCHGM